MKATIRVSFPTDENGLTGRECPACEGYFKLRFGTGLPVSATTCPYCGHAADGSEFLTPDQQKLVQSELQRQFVAPLLRDFQRSLKNLERRSSSGLVRIKVHTSPLRFPLHQYQERELETQVTCDACGLEFAIYGVFAGCPDCGRLNALVVFERSLTVASRRLGLLDSLGDEDRELAEALVRDALTGACSAFDGLGKALRARHADVLPAKPVNLFQNLDALSDALRAAGGRSLAELLGEEVVRRVRCLFQVRHIVEHNMGVVDDVAVTRIPQLAPLRGRKYPLRREEAEQLIKDLLPTGRAVSALLDELHPRNGDSPTSPGVNG